MQETAMIKLTNLGKEEYAKWQGLRNFLIDFSKLNKEELPKVELWGKYLVYATVLDVGDEVLKAMRIKIEQNSDIELTDTSGLLNNDRFELISSVSSISKRTTSSIIAPIGIVALSALDGLDRGSGGGRF